MHQSSHKLFVLVDRTLSKPQQAVQACHAVAEFALKYGREGWKHESLVLLGVDDHIDLERMWHDCMLVPHDRIGFREPHYNNRMTAVACYGCDDEVKELKLL